jgi:hypothetical protein
MAIVILRRGVCPSFSNVGYSARVRACGAIGQASDRAPSTSHRRPRTPNHIGRTMDRIERRKDVVAIPSGGRRAASDVIAHFVRQNAGVSDVIAIPSGVTRSASDVTSIPSQVTWLTSDLRAKGVRRKSDAERRHRNCVRRRPANERSHFGSVRPERRDVGRKPRYQSLAELLADCYIGRPHSEPLVSDELWERIKPLIPNPQAGRWSSARA